MSNGASGSAAENALPTAGLLQRLLQTIARNLPAEQPQEGESTFGDLPPAGRRSGRGAASVAPYLTQFRSTRPGSLDDGH